MDEYILLKSKLGKAAGYVCGADWIGGGEAVVSMRRIYYPQVRYVIGTDELSWGKISISML